MVKNLPGTAGDVGSNPGQKGQLAKERATHSSILVWQISRTGEPGGLLSIGLQSMGFKRVGYDLVIKQHS